VGTDQNQTTRSVRGGTGKLVQQKETKNKKRFKGSGEDEKKHWPYWLNHRERGGRKSIAFQTLVGMKKEGLFVKAKGGREFKEGKGSQVGKKCGTGEKVDKTRLPTSTSGSVSWEGCWVRKNEQQHSAEKIRGCILAKNRQWVHSKTRKSTRGAVKKGGSRAQCPKTAERCVF